MSEHAPLPPAHRSLIVEAEQYVPDPITDRVLRSSALLLARHVLSGTIDMHDIADPSVVSDALHTSAQAVAMPVADILPADGTFPRGVRKALRYASQAVFVDTITHGVGLFAGSGHDVAFRLEGAVDMTEAELASASSYGFGVENGPIIRLINSVRKAFEHGSALALTEGSVTRDFITCLDYEYAHIIAADPSRFATKLPVGLGDTSHGGEGPFEFGSYVFTIARLMWENPAFAFATPEQRRDFAHHRLGIMATRANVRLEQFRQIPYVADMDLELSLTRAAGPMNAKIVDTHGYLSNRRDLEGAELFGPRLTCPANFRVREADVLEDAATSDGHLMSAQLSVGHATINLAYQQGIFDARSQVELTEMGAWMQPALQEAITAERQRLPEWQANFVIRQAAARESDHKIPNLLLEPGVPTGPCPSPRHTAYQA